HGGLSAVTDIAIAHAQAAWEALTTYAETQEHLLEIIMAIFAVPIRRTRWDWPLTPVGLLFIGPIEGDRRRILVQPGGRDGIDIEGMERDRPKHAVQRRRKQRLEDLPQPVIMERGARQARLEQGYHPAFLQTCSHLIEGMMAIQNRQEQRLDPTATGEDMGGGRRAEGIDECRHVEFADHPQHQRPVSYRTDLMNCKSHEA